MDIGTLILIYCLVLVLLALPGRFLLGKMAAQSDRKRLQAQRQAMAADPQAYPFLEFKPQVPVLGENTPLQLEDEQL